ncbi:TetR/AcrR family transcriptional regulator [Curtobacterium sp. RRHDQ10]|uniref:TetR/AcrR family transcriptional regulator n=1 Tax=Curtobacterium phyllosphaerae TaxID=3413379 RepID=UPI003BF1BECF
MTELRSTITDAAIETFRGERFASVSPETVAERAGVPVAEVSRAFPVWELLVVAVVNRWQGASRRALRSVAEQDGTVAYLRAMLEDAAADPAMVRVRLAVLVAASEPTYPASGWYRQQYDAFVQDVGLFLTRDVIGHREPRTMSAASAAHQLTALYEGLQLQHALGAVTDLLPTWDRAVARFRWGWNTAYAPPATPAP